MAAASHQLFAGIKVGLVRFEEDLKLFRGAEVTHPLIRSLNRRNLIPGVEAVFEAGGTFFDFRSKLPPNGKYQNGEQKSYPRTADFT